VICSTSHLTLSGSDVTATVTLVAADSQKSGSNLSIDSSTLPGEFGVYLIE